MTSTNMADSRSNMFLITMLITMNPNNAYFPKTEFFYDFDGREEKKTEFLAWKILLKKGVGGPGNLTYPYMGGGHKRRQKLLFYAYYSYNW
mgnify:CR=1 FL=1